jgi:pilus assembly protein CpaB
MKAKTMVPLVLGLGVGFFAVKMGVDLVKKAKGAQDRKEPSASCRQDTEVATKITDAMLGSTKIPAVLVPSNALQTKALVGRVTAMTVAPGVPITTAMLAPPGAEPGLAAIIPKGHRAVAVSVNEESAVAGFILPGARVDVSTVDEKTRTSSLILTDIEVGAVGQSLSEVGSDGKTTRITKSVTLFLEPNEVQTLHAQSGKGRIRLSLRGVAGESESSWSKIMANAFAQSPAPPPPAPAPKEKPQRVLVQKPPRVVEVLHGAAMETLVFDASGRLRQATGEPARCRRRAPAPRQPAMNTPVMAPFQR